jgi:hypothetical protein
MGSVGPTRGSQHLVLAAKPLWDGVGITARMAPLGDCQRFRLRGAGLRPAGDGGVQERLPSSIAPAGPPHPFAPHTFAPERQPASGDGSHLVAPFGICGLNPYTKSGAPPDRTPPGREGVVAPGASCSIDPTHEPAVAILLLWRMAGRTLPTPPDGGDHTSRPGSPERQPATSGTRCAAPLIPPSPRCGRHL